MDRQAVQRAHRSDVGPHGADRKARQIGKHRLKIGSTPISFIAAPFVFGWSGLVFAYYLVMGTGVLVVVALFPYTRIDLLVVRPGKIASAWIFAAAGTQALI